MHIPEYTINKYAYDEIKENIVSSIEEAILTRQSYRIP